jgi:hypothetical protein
MTIATAQGRTRAHLPLSPWLLIPAYIGAPFAVMAWAELSGYRIDQTVIGIATMSMLAVQYWWCYQTVNFVSKLADERKRGRSNGYRVVLVPVFVFLVLVFACVGQYDNYEKPFAAARKLEWLLDRENGVLGFGTAFVAFSPIWIAARVMREAEEERKLAPLDVVGAFILFFYTPICAPFIYRRLKNLDT